MNFKKLIGIQGNDDDPPGWENMTAEERQTWGQRYYVARIEHECGAEITAAVTARDRADVPAKLAELQLTCARCGKI